MDYIVGGSAALKDLQTPPLLKQTLKAANTRISFTQNEELNLFKELTESVIKVGFSKPTTIREKAYYRFSGQLTPNLSGTSLSDSYTLRVYINGEQLFSVNQRAPLALQFSQPFRVPKNSILKVTLTNSGASPFSLTNNPDTNFFCIERL